MNLFCSSFPLNEIHDTLDYLKKNQLKIYSFNNIKDSYLKKNNKNIKPFVAVLKNSNVIGKHCVIVHKKNSIIRQGYDPLQSGFSPLIKYYYKIPKEKQINATLGVISNSDNYFHWMIEILPRFLLLNKFRNKIDYYALDTEKSFQKEAIEELNIPENKIVPLSKDTNINAKQTYMASRLMPSGKVNKTIITFLNDIFLKNKEKIEKYKKIYIMRGKCKNGRIVVNEKEVISFLKKYRFYPLKMDDFPVKKQAQIFYSAKYIIAPHGAALTNLVFANRNCKVLEIFSSKYINDCFKNICKVKKIKYERLVTKPRRNNIHINLNNLKNKINKW